MRLLPSVRHLRGLVRAAPLSVIALGGCASATDAGAGVPHGRYVLLAYNGHGLPAAVLCSGGYTLTSGEMVLLQGEAARTVQYHDAAGAHTVSQHGTYTGAGDTVSFDLVEDGGNHWKVNGTFRDGRLDLQYPAPCDGTEVESYLVP
jgi:hypothetical protein